MNIREGVALAEDKQSCTSEIYGYVGTIDGAVTVLPPIWVSRDNMKVCFIHMSLSGEYQAPMIDDIQALLEQEYIEYGVSDGAIATLCRGLASGSAVDRATLIAVGTQPKQGRGSTWEFSFDPALTQSFEQCSKLLNRNRLELLVEGARGLAGKVASAGELLATKRAAVAGIIGTDVYGEEVLPEETEDLELEMAGHIRLSEDGTECFSEIYGWVGAQKDRVSIVAPIWISPAGMTAYFINLPQLGEKRRPSFEEISHLLELTSVCYGIDHKVIQVLCECMRQDLSTELAIPIARGKPLEPGQDAQVEFTIEVERKPGTVRKDGSIDFKNLNLVPRVEAGQTIALEIPARKGVSGKNVFAEELRSEDGRDIRVRAGKNISQSELEDQQVQLFSDIDGGLVILRHKERVKGTSQEVVELAVYPVQEVPGDVNYSTGHIDFEILSNVVDEGRLSMA